MGLYSFYSETGHFPLCLWAVEPAVSPHNPADMGVSSTHPTPRLLSWSSGCCWHHPWVLSPGLPPRAVQVKKKRRCGSSQEQEHLQILPCSWDNQSIKLTCKQVLWASTRVMGQTCRFASRDLHSSLGLTWPYRFFSAINCPFSSAFLEQNLKFIHNSKISMTKNRKVIWKQPCQTIWGTSVVPTTTINCPISHYMPYSFFR